MGPNYYPPGDRDWIGTNEIRRVAEHNEALSAEKYVHDVGAFRESFYGKLAAYSTLVDGFGWAIFNGEGEEGSVATAGPREVLIMSRVRPQAQREGSTVPLVRIITNELVTNGDDHFLLTEEITIDEDGDAQYLTDAVRMDTDDDEHAARQRGQAIMQSVSPLFVVAEENQLGFSSNTQEVTPIFKVTDPSGTLPAATPFGYPGVIEDNLYALAKAQEILDSILACDPSHSY